MPPSLEDGAGQQAERYPPPPPVRRAENPGLKVDRARAGPAAHHEGRRLNPGQNAPGRATDSTRSPGTAPHTGEKDPIAQLPMRNLLEN